MIEIRFDDAKLKQLEKELKGIPRALPKVMSRSLNRTAMTVRTRLSRLGAKKLGWRVKDVRSYIDIRRASYKNWRSTLGFPTRSIDAISLKAREQKKGVSYKDPLTGRRERLPGAFIYDMPVRGKQVWLRSIYYLGRRKYVSWRGRRMEALYKVRAPSLLKLLMVHAKEQTDEIIEQSSAILAKSVHDQVQLILKRRIPA